jgi:hypothetical protein
MIFLRFGSEFINLNQVYQIDVKETDRGVILAFFYHLAGSTSGGYKVSPPFKSVDEAVNSLSKIGIDIVSFVIQGASNDT